MSSACSTLAPLVLPWLENGFPFNQLSFRRFQDIFKVKLYRTSKGIYRDLTQGNTLRTMPKMFYFRPLLLSKSIENKEVFSPGSYLIFSDCWFFTLSGRLSCWVHETCTECIVPEMNRFIEVPWGMHRITVFLCKIAEAISLFSHQKGAIIRGRGEELSQGRLIKTRSLLEQIRSVI